MPAKSKSKRRATQNDLAQLLRGGKAVPTDLVRRCVADLQKTRATALQRRTATEQKMAKYLGQARPTPPVDPGRTDSLDALLALHKKLAKQRLLPPGLVGGVGGVFPGQITVTVVPPFDYKVIIPSRLAGNDATLDGSANENTGQMDVSAITATQKGFNGGSMYTTVGIYFHPLGPGTLTVHATPRYSFQWWRNSLGDNDLVRSFGSGGLTVYGVDVASQTTGGVGTIVSTASTRFTNWDETQTAQVGFDFGFDIDAPTSVQLDVDHNLVYLLFVEADVHVEGVGWPGSLAGAKLSVTVPSITYDFKIQQVLTQ